MKDEIIFFVVLLLLVAAIIGGNVWGFRIGYKEACENFYAGSLRMELKETPGGDRSWEWKE